MGPLTSDVAASMLKDRLLAYCEAQYRAIHRRQPDGEHIGKGIRLAGGLIRGAGSGPDAKQYLESLRRVLMDEKRRVRGTQEDDPYGWALGGIQTVVNEVERELKKLGGP